MTTIEQPELRFRVGETVVDERGNRALVTDAKYSYKHEEWRYHVVIKEIDTEFIARVDYAHYVYSKLSGGGDSARDNA
jgi:hypothetical protein